MVDDQDIFRVLIIEDSLNEAETYVSALRSGGHAVRAKQVSNPDQLQAALAEQQYEMAICTTPLNGCRIEDAITVIARSEKDIPLIAIVERPTQDALIEALRAGARDALPKGQHEHLRLVVDREMSDLKIRRALRDMQQRYREAERRSRALLDTARDAITYVIDGMHIRANDAYLTLFGFTDAEEIEGMPLMDMIAPDDHSALKQFLRGLPELNKGSAKLEVMGQRIDGQTFPLTLVFSPAVVDEEECFQVVIPAQQAATSASAPAEHQELEDKIKTLSNRDLLTGLYNRQFFIEELELKVTEVLGGSAQLALMLVAVDNFDAIVDRVGIAASDMVVVDVADLLNENLEENQTLARFSDQMFAILTHYKTPKDVEKLADAIRQKIEEHVSEVNGQAINPTASIGITLVSENAASAQEVLRRAHQCCDQARNDGGNRTQVYTPSAVEQAIESSADVMSKVVNTALEKDAFTLLYQPISSLRGDQHEYYEVYLRLADEKGNEIPTKHLVAAAERAGLMPRVDRWVAEHALQRLAEEHAKGERTNFFLNLSDSTLGDEDYLPWLAGRLKELRISGEYLVIEVKEPAASANIQALKLLIKGLKALRSRLALAQFGSGLNSLNFLKHVPASFVKVDRAFMVNLPTNKESQNAVKDIASAAHELGMECIAEFVEDASSLPLLWQAEVDYIQGYFLQEPSTELNFDFSGESF